MYSLNEKSPGYEQLFLKNTFENVNNFYYYRMETLKILTNYKHMKEFYKLLIDLHIHHCDDYNTLIENIVNWDIYKIKYGKKTITRDY